MQPEIRPRRRAPLSSLLLVGGATRMPAVGRFLTNMTGLQPLEAALDPDEAVALGAAVQAGILQGEISNLMVMDQWQASLMRALAKLQLQADPRVRQRLEQQYSLEDEGESALDEAAAGGEEGVSGSGDGDGEAGVGSGRRKQVPKRQRRRQQQKQQKQQQEKLEQQQRVRAGGGEGGQGSADVDTAAAAAAEPASMDA
ncbi:hypothetical protein PLESTM_001931900 [Pleodorina starrii]|nr:hypothetical protein PLESTM_001931900 [Pleodorina starrii]